MLAGRRHVLVLRDKEEREAVVLGVGRRGAREREVVEGMARAELRSECEVSVWIPNYKVSVR